jgi:hypothetical protein
LKKYKIFSFAPRRAAGMVPEKEGARIPPGLLMDLNIQARF